MSAPIRVLIADDSFVVRGGLRHAVEATAGFEVVAEAASGREALARAREVRPDVVLMDLRMRDLDGIAATRELTATLPNIRTLVISWSDDPDHVREALTAGARGYLVHGRFGAADLEHALRAVAEGDAIVTPVIASEIIADARRRAGNRGTSTHLTPRELEILALVRRGKRNREIAAALGIEEKTIKNHLNSIYSKLDLGSRIEAMAVVPPVPEKEQRAP